MEKGLEKSEARVTGSLGLRQLVKLSKEKVGFFVFLFLIFIRGRGRKSLVLSFCL